MQIEAICLSLGARPAKAKPYTFDQKSKDALMTSFDLENADPKSRNLEHDEFLCEPTSLQVSCF